MARPAGFSDSEDSDFDDFLHSNHNVSHISPPKQPDIFEDIQVPSLNGLTVDTEGFKRDIAEGNLDAVRQYISSHSPEIRTPLVNDSSSKNGWYEVSPLEIAASSGQVAILTLLLEESQKKENSKDGPCPLLAIASAFGDAPEANLISCASLLLSTEDMDRSEASSGLTPLMVAAKTGFESLVCLLIKAGADVELCDYSKWSAVCHSAHSGNGNVLRTLLVEGKASPSVLTTEGWEPSDLAERKGHSHILEILDAFSESRSVFRGVLQAPTGGDITLILKGFGLNHDEISSFSREGVVDLPTLLTLSERDLRERLGISRVGVLKSLCEFIKDMHRKEWRRSCLPKVQVYDPSQGLKFSCPEAISVMGNVRKQLLYLRSTLVYLTRGISENPDVLQIGKDSGNVSDLYKYAGASHSDGEGLLKDIKDLRRTLYPFLTEEFMPVDEVRSPGGGRTHSKWSLLILLSAIPLGCCYMLGKYMR